MRGLIAIVGLLALTSTAEAAVPTTVLVERRTVAQDTERMTYRYGPLLAGAGQNLIMVGPVTIEKPPFEFFTTRIEPSLVRADGKAPPVEQVHMHHAVMLNMKRQDAGAPEVPERFYGFAEEKTTGTLPAGYGYRVRPDDVWAVNYMLHNGTTVNEWVYVQYAVDVVRADTPTGRAMKDAHPLWLDVQNGRAYPVFDVKRGAGRDGMFTYPDEARDPYRDDRRRDLWRVPKDMTLLAAAGHLHPGGLWVDLHADRGGRSAHLFRSEAKYFDPNGPVSWDLAMTYTRPDWRVGLKAGDVLRVSTTYDSSRASWYESMGLTLVYYADESGPDPFVSPPDTTGEVTHGHLPEAGNHGGQPVAGAPDMTAWNEMGTIDRRVGIGAFAYLPGDMGSPAEARGVPAVNPGESLRFGNLDATAQIFHSVTACRAPCNRSTGISYPIADGEGDFDSGSLGYGPQGYTAAAQRAEWDTPKDLEPGTYTYFCRIHPFMRGAFRVRGQRRGRSGAGVGAAPSRRAPRRLALSSRRLRIRRGTVRVPVACPRGGARCRGRLVLTVRRARLGTARFSLAPGRRARIRIRLRRAVMNVLRPRAAQLVIDQAGVARRAVAVRLTR